MNALVRVVVGVHVHGGHLHPLAAGLVEVGLAHHHILVTGLGLVHAVRCREHPPGSDDAAAAEMKVAVLERGHELILPGPGRASTHYRVRGRGENGAGHRRRRGGHEQLAEHSHEISHRWFPRPATEVRNELELEKVT